MIGKVDGTISLVGDRFAIVDTNGIGYKVFMTENTIRSVEVGQKVALWTHLAVREDALDLYGFRDMGELSFFQMLIDISGIGPRSALSILGLAPIETLSRAIASGDISYLVKVSGIGKKTAEKIVLELRDKLSVGRN